MPNWSVRIIERTVKEYIVEAEDEGTAEQKFNEMDTFESENDVWTLDSEGPFVFPA